MIEFPQKSHYLPQKFTLSQNLLKNLLISSEFSQQSLFLPQKSASLPHNSLMNLPLFPINLHFSLRILLSLRKFLYSVRISIEIFFFSEISFLKYPSEISLRNILLSDRNLLLFPRFPSEILQSEISNFH